MTTGRCGSQAWPAKSPDAPSLLLVGTHARHGPPRIADRKGLLQQIIENFPSQKSHIRIMVITFFDTKVIDHNEFASIGSSVLSKKYPVALNRQLERITRVKPCWEQQRLGRDNATVYTAMMTNIRNFLSRNLVAVLIIPHRHILPKWSPPESFFFSKFEIENESLPI